MFLTLALGLVSGGIPSYFHQSPLTMAANFHYSPRQPLTFPERVRYQQALEEVLWRHRIWPKENPGPKPDFAQVVTKAQLEAQVVEYLTRSNALAAYRQRPITGEDLQAELDRMAQTTQNVPFLYELFAALNYDPFLLAECLARPALVEQQPLPPDFLAKARLEVPEVAFSYTLPQIQPAKTAPEGNGFNGTWAAFSSGLENGRARHSAVWTGVEMVIWGGSNGSYLNTGLRYRPATNSWRELPLANAPSARVAAPAVWTGLEMILWGGSDSPDFALKTGGRYNPTTNAWTPTTTTQAPTARRDHTCVWTGTEMIVWGGYDGSSSNTGGRYNPTDNSWLPTKVDPVSPGRSQHTAIWTGSEMILWGGFVSGTTIQGVRYSPTTDRWIACNPIGQPDNQAKAKSVWTGTEMIVWGGSFVSLTYGGGRYSPATDTWTQMNTVGQPSMRFDFATAWTGTGMVVWGGWDNSTASFNDGAIYYPADNVWAKMNPDNAPSARSGITGIWTGTEMLMWGGTEPCGRFTPSAFSLPVVAGFYPLASSPGKTITVYGSGFVQGNTTVSFGGSFFIQATVTVVSPEQLQVVVPPSQIGTSNVNGYLTIRANGSTRTTEALPINAGQPQNPNSTFPEFVLQGDANGDGMILSNDLTLCRAFIQFQTVPTARQRLAVDVVPSNSNGSRGDGNLNTTDFVFLRAVTLGQATF